MTCLGELTTELIKDIICNIWLKTGSRAPRPGILSKALLYEFIESYCAPTRTPPTAVEGALESGRNSVRARVGASSESGRSNPVNARKDGDF